MAHKQTVAFRSDDGVHSVNTGRYVEAIEYPFREFWCHGETCTVVDIPEPFSTGRAAYLYWRQDGTFEAIPMRRSDIVHEEKE
jgi:hypothetical protein